MIAKYCLVSLLSFVLVCSNSPKSFGQTTTEKKYGIYRDNVAALGFFVRKFEINSNNTFTYRFRGDLLSDTSAGTYYLVKDTIFFQYQYNNYDSIYQKYKREGKPVPIEITLSDNSSHLRPKKLLWENDKMFYFHVETGKIVRKGIENSKEIDIYLGLIK